MATVESAQKKQKLKQIAKGEETRKNKPNGKVVTKWKTKIMTIEKCTLSHEFLNDFRLAKNYWEVGKAFCTIKCKKNILINLYAVQKQYEYVRETGNLVIV